MHRTIDEVDAVQWNCLAGNNAFATHGWLRTIEASCRVPLQALYFTLTHSGRLVASAVCYVCPPTSAIETLDDLIFGRLTETVQALGVSYLPAIVCGPLLGYGWHVGLHHALSDQEAAEACRAVLDAIAAEADARGLPLAFVHVLDDESHLDAFLNSDGYLRCRNIPVAVLDITSASFEQYLASVPGKRRREFQRQINRYRDGGSEIIRLDDPVAAEARLLALLDANSIKRNGRPFSSGRGFIASLIDGADGVSVFASRKSGVMTATSIMLIQRRTAFLIAIGVDYQAAGDDYSYFQVTYNAPIAHAIERGIERIYYGRGLDDVKVRRGCWLTNSWIYVRPRPPMRLPTRAWFAVASTWNRQKLAREARQSVNN